MEPNALIISDENYSGYLTHTTNNVISVRAFNKVEYDTNNPINTFSIPTYSPTNFISHDSDNTYTTL